MKKLRAIWRGLSRSQDEAGVAEESAVTVPSVQVKPVRVRRSIALLRLLDADCPSCRGFGCAICGGTGLG